MAARRAGHHRLGRRVRSSWRRACRTRTASTCVPAFVGLGAPHWDPHARGAIFGLTRGANRAHIARATLEAIAFQTRDVIEAVERDSGVTLTELRVDGGAAANDLLLQIQATPGPRRRAAGGAGDDRARRRYLAGLAVGFWKDAGDVVTQLARGPALQRAQCRPTGGTRLYAGWKRAVERVKGWATG